MKWKAAPNAFENDSITAAIAMHTLRGVLQRLME